MTAIEIVDSPMSTRQHVVDTNRARRAQWSADLYGGSVFPQIVHVAPDHSATTSNWPEAVSPDEPDFASGAPLHFQPILYRRMTAGTLGDPLDHPNEAGPPRTEVGFRPSNLTASRFAAEFAIRIGLGLSSPGFERWQDHKNYRWSTHESALPMMNPVTKSLLSKVRAVVERSASANAMPTTVIEVRGVVSPEEGDEEILIRQWVETSREVAFAYWDKLEASIEEFAGSLDQEERDIFNSAIGLEVRTTR